MLAANLATCYSRSVTRTESQTTPTDLKQSVTGNDKWSWFIWGALAVLLAYPLSLGPVGKLYEGPRPAPNAVRAFYAPVGLAYHQSETVRKTLDWYAGLWGACL